MKKERKVMSGHLSRWRPGPRLPAALSVRRRSAPRVSARTLAQSAMFATLKVLPHEFILFCNIENTYYQRHESQLEIVLSAKFWPRVFPAAVTRAAELCRDARK